MLWSGKDPARIPADLLCGDVVLKANHGSGFNLPVQGGKYDVDVLVDKARRWMRVDFGRIHGEWGYRNVDRRIFVEEMLFDEGVPVRTEYKFHVCGGRTAYIVVKLETEEGGTEFLVLDRDGRAFSVPDTGVGEPVHFELPTNFSRMRTVAERLGGEFDFIRVDLYDLGDSVYFSELTVYPGSGRGRVGNADLMRRRNDLWDLRSSWFLGVPHSGWRQRYACALRRLLDSRLPTTDGNSKAPFPRVREKRS